MHELEFAEAAIPSQTVCLGLRLRHYSIRHELALLKRKSAFLCLSRDEFDALPESSQASELVRGVLSCCEKTPRWLRLWDWFHQDDDITLAIADFRNYLTAGRAMMPSLSSSSAEDRDAYEIGNKGDKMESGRSLGSPMIANMIIFAIKELGCSQDEALDAPFGHIGNLYLAFLESEGSILVENAAEHDAKMQVSKQREAVNLEKNAAKTAWESAKTPAEQLEAFEKHPRIGNLFAEEWNNAQTDDEKAKVERKWPVIAERVLEQSGLKGITVCQD